VVCEDAALSDLFLIIDTHELSFSKASEQQILFEFSAILIVFAIEKVDPFAGIIVPTRTINAKLRPKHQVRQDFG
jgi:hypothetical protein